MERIPKKAPGAKGFFFGRYSFSAPEEVLSLGREVDLLLSRAEFLPGGLEKAVAIRLRSLREKSLVQEGLSLGARDQDLLSRLAIAWRRHCDSVTIVGDMRRLVEREGWPRSVRYCLSSYSSAFLAGDSVSSWFLNAFFVGEHLFGKDASAHLLLETDLSRIPVPLIYYPPGEMEPLDSEVYAFLDLIRESLSREG